jgi:hypothetical protein
LFCNFCSPSVPVACGGALQLGDRGDRELGGPPEVMRVKDGLDIGQRVPRDRRYFGHLATRLCEARHGQPVRMHSLGCRKTANPRS